MIIKTRSGLAIFKSEITDNIVHGNELIIEEQELEVDISYANLSLQFIVEEFVQGPKETRAWTVRQGSTAPQAAGVIHTDFEKGFIRAETIGYDDFVSLGGEQAAKDAGKMRQEGKEYVVKDGDVMHFLFNV